MQALLGHADIATTQAYASPMHDGGAYRFGRRFGWIENRVGVISWLLNIT